MPNRKEIRIPSNFANSREHNNHIYTYSQGIDINVGYSYTGPFFVLTLYFKCYFQPSLGF